MNAEKQGIKLHIPDIVLVYKAAAIHSVVLRVGNRLFTQAEAESVLDSVEKARKAAFTPEEREKHVRRVIDRFGS